MKFQTHFTATLGLLATAYSTVAAVKNGNGTTISNTKGTLSLTSTRTAITPINGTTISTINRPTTSIGSYTAIPNSNRPTISVTNSTTVSTNNETPVSNNNGTAVSDNSGSANAHCDATCAHRFIFYSGYNGAKDGLFTVFGLCDTYDWCYSDGKEWCPDVINSTLTRIASEVKDDVTAGMDYNNINNLTMISTILTVNARSRRMAISVAQSFLESGNQTCSAGQVTELEKIRWLMGRQEGPIDYDASVFEDYMADQDGKALEKRSDAPNTWLRDNMPWFDRLVQGAKRFLKTLRLRMLRNAIKPPTPPTWSEQEVNYNQDFKPWWEREGSKAAKEWVDEVPDDFKPVPRDALQPRGAPEPFSPPELPSDFAKGVPPEEIPPGHEPPLRPKTPPPAPTGPPGKIPIKPRPPPDPPLPERPPIPSPMPPQAPRLELFRAEEFHPVTGTLKQLTVTPSELTSTPAHVLEATKELGLERFDVLDAFGDVMQTKLLDPKTLASTPGQWESLGDQFVRQSFNNLAQGLPVLDSLGQPMIANAEGSLMTLAQKANNLASAAVGTALGSAFSRAFDMFSPGGGSSGSEGTVVYNSIDGTVDISDPPSLPEHSSEDTVDHQNGDENTGNDSEQSDSEDEEDKSDEAEDAQTTETTAPETTASETNTAKSNTATATPTTSDPDMDHQTTTGPTHAAPTDATPTAEFEPTQTTQTPKQKSVETQHQATSNPYPYPNSHLPLTFATPTNAQDATETSKTHIQTSSNPYPYPNSHLPLTFDTPTSPHDVTATTFATVTTSSKPEASTSFPAMPAFTTITGCQSNSDCPVCLAETSCQIGDLPPECVRSAINIDNVAIAGNYTWDECVDKIRKLNREEAKAWANAIILPYCVSENEWEPIEIDEHHHGECGLDVGGDEFSKVEDIWITGMLPLECPANYNAEHFDWDGFDDDLKENCDKAAYVLETPFKNG